LIEPVGGILCYMNRRFSLLGLLGIILIAPSMAEGVYMWEDDNGQVHYSDIPQEGAIEVQVQPAQTFSSPNSSLQAAAADNTSNDAASDSDKEDQRYQSLAITSPSSEETIWNTGGKVTVSLSLQPGLKTGHSIRLFMDGQTLADFPSKSMSMQLSNVYRGEHTLRAQVVDETGKVQAKAESVTFFYQQTSVNRRPSSRF
jgi:hypothetical protein